MSWLAALPAATAASEQGWSDDHGQYIIIIGSSVGFLNIVKHGDCDSQLAPCRMMELGVL